VMISTSAEEERARVAPRDAIEAECLGEERCRLVDVADVQMHVADDRPGGHARPRSVASLTQQTFDIHRIGCHHQLAADGPARIEEPNEFALLPRPQRPGGPRILIGGKGKRTISYVVRYAQEWNCVMLAPKEFANLSNKLDEMLGTAGRKPESVRRSMMTGCVFGKDDPTLKEKVALCGRSLKQLQQNGLIAGSKGEVKEQLQKLEQVGLQRIMLQWLDLDDLESLEALAKTVL